MRVVLLRSADRVFCSGADLSEAAEGGMEEGAQALVALQRRILSHRSPVVTRLAGPVRAGGLGIVAASDIVLCSDDVTFAFTEVRLALTPAVISLTVLPRLTSRGAADSFLTGRKFDAAEAAQMGLVTRSVAPEALDDEVARVCADLVKGHPQGLRETKALLAAPVLANLDAQADEMAAPERPAVRVRRGPRRDAGLPQQVGLRSPAGSETQPRTNGEWWRSPASGSTVMCGCAANSSSTATRA